MFAYLICIDYDTDYVNDWNSYFIYYSNFAINFVVINVSVDIFFGHLQGCIASGI